MMPAPTSLNIRKTGPERCLTWVCCAVACVVGIGCRQRAYTELYVENMASEVRMLEDRIWEYDAAYRDKDSEYERLVQEVARLKKRTSELQRKQSTQKLDADGVQMSPARPPNLQLDHIETIQAQPFSIPTDQYEVPSVLVPETIANPPVRTPVAPPTQTNRNPAPSVEDLLPPAGDSSLQSPLTTPVKPKELDEPRASSGIRLPKKNPNVPDINSLTEQVSIPESMVRSAQQPKQMTVPEVRQDSPSNANPARPNLLPSLLRRLPKINDGDPQGSNQNGKIRLPEGSKVQFASAIETTPQQHKPNQASDQKMVEIAFHPIMCRGHNFDEKPGDDGLYLVVTPMNAEGQVINQIGTLTVIVEDPTASKNNARVGAWEFTSEQLAELLEPVGASQGFHLSLPWPAKPPTCKDVSVYLRFASENGRTLVNQREVHLRIPAFEQQVWTPRKTNE